MNDPTQEPRSGLEEAFISAMSEALQSQYMTPKHPDIVRRVCVYSIEENSHIWQMWKAGRAQGLNEAAAHTEFLATCWSNLNPSQSKQIAAFFARNIRELKDQK